MASEAMMERIKKALASDKRSTVTVLSSLFAVHDELGHLPREAIEEVAAFNDATINDVWGVATFYTNFRFTPPPDHTVEVCWGPTCHIKGSAAIMSGCMQALGLDGEGDAANGKVSLKYNACLGACSQAPVVSINHRLRGGITPEEMQERVAGLMTDSNGAHAERRL